MTTILEALESAQYNFSTVGRTGGVGSHPIFAVASEQLANCIKALEDGKSADDELLLP